MFALALRVLTAAAVIASAVVHLQVWFAGFRTIPVIGPLFLLNVIGGFAIGLAVLAWRHWLPLLASVGFGVATLAAFVVSATVGLFGVHETWTGTAQVLGEVTEVVAVVAGLAAIAVLSGRRGASRPWVTVERRHRPAG
ncbi:MAG TPA: hypothetical protein VFL99_03660 [Segeticoccus sp.]|uniref:hypothetical protein n=1 Tax=Segeticoccus sp. TaxID=2706531 RepID=UPI002D7F08DB|nr:hypothetical protein [Segeticoccus sp.]HET8599397.1 hypothetical protein [Segeticoccus sp.]